MRLKTNKAIILQILLPQLYVRDKTNSSSQTAMQHYDNDINTAILTFTLTFI